MDGFTWLTALHNPIWLWPGCEISEAQPIHLVVPCLEPKWRNRSPLTTKPHSTEVLGGRSWHEVCTPLFKALHLAGLVYTGSEGAQELWIAYKWGAEELPRVSQPNDGFQSCFEVEAEACQYRRAPGKWYAVNITKAPLCCRQVGWLPVMCGDLAIPSRGIFFAGWSAEVALYLRILCDSGCSQCPGPQAFSWMFHSHQGSQPRVAGRTWHTGCTWRKIGGLSGLFEDVWVLFWGISFPTCHVSYLLPQLPLFWATLPTFFWHCLPLTSLPSRDRFGCSLDYQKAYDLMDPRGTLGLMTVGGFPPWLVSVCKNVWLHQRRWIVYDGHVHPCPLPAGVATAQGVSSHLPPGDDLGSDKIYMDDRSFSAPTSRVLLLKQESWAQWSGMLVWRKVLTRFNISSVVGVLRLSLWPRCRSLSRLLILALSLVVWLPLLLVKMLLRKNKELITPVVPVSLSLSLFLSLSCLRLPWAKYLLYVRIFALSQAIYGWISRLPTLA